MFHHYNHRTQNTFVYCGQLNALEGFAWVIWYVFVSFHLPRVSVELIAFVCDRVLVTFAIIVVFVRGIIAARRGDGFRGPLMSV